MELTARQTRVLQLELNRDGFMTAVDGDYGPKTDLAFRQWRDQQDGLEQAFALRRLITRCSNRIGFNATPMVFKPSIAASTWVNNLVTGYNLSLTGVQVQELSLLHDGLADNASHPDQLVARIAEWFLIMGVKETRQNRGPWVDVIIALGGGDVQAAPPWCAYFVGTCRLIASKLSAFELEFARSGSAVRTYLNAAFKLQGWHKGAPIGAAFSRLRTSVDESKIDGLLEAVWAGDSAQGHTGIKIVTLPTGDALAVAGNSSGSGHSGGRGGRVALEVVGPVNGTAAWRRLVGFSTVRHPATKVAA